MASRVAICVVAPRPPAQEARDRPARRGAVDARDATPGVAALQVQLGVEGNAQRDQLADAFGPLLAPAPGPRWRGTARVRPAPCRRRAARRCRRRRSPRRSHPGRASCSNRGRGPWSASARWRPVRPRRARPSTRPRRPRRRERRAARPSPWRALTDRSSAQRRPAPLVWRRAYCSAGPDSHDQSMAMPRSWISGPRDSRRRGSGTSRAGRPRAAAFVVAARRRRSPCRRPGRSSTSTTVSARPPVRMHDRRGAVAQGDHLALAARLEARRHDDTGPLRRRCAAPGPDRSASRTATDSGVRRGADPEDRPRSAGSPDAQGHDPRARPASSSVAAPGQQVEALLRIQPADHAEHRRRSSSGSKPSSASRARRQAALPSRSAARVAARPEPCPSPDSRPSMSRPLRMPAETMPEPGEDLVQAHARTRRRHDLRRVSGADGVHQLGSLDPLAQQQDAVGVGRHDQARARPGRRGRRSGRGSASPGRRGCGS